MALLRYYVKRASKSEKQIPHPAQTAGIRDDKVVRNGAAKLGRELFYGTRRKRNYKKAFPFLLQGATEGSIHSQYLAAYALANGLGTKRNFDRARYWYTRVVRNAPPDAIAEAAFDLAITYTERGSKADLRAARYWYGRAIQNGHPEAPFNLARMYETGEGTKPNPRKSFLLYKKGAKRGDPWAQCNLAICYAEGLGTAKNIRESVRWFRKAANQGDAKSQYNVGLAYLDGEGVRTSEKHARRWFLKAARQGHKRAKRLLRKT